MAIVMSLVIWHAMHLRKYPPMPRNRRGSARDSALNFVEICVCTSALPSRSWLTRLSVLKQARPTSRPPASILVTLVPHPALALTSAVCGFLTLLCHPSIHRGHPMRCLAQLNSLHLLRPMEVHPPTLLHAPPL